VMSSSWPNFLAASGNGMRGLVADGRVWTLFFCISNSPQNRHPERSASQIVRVTRCLVARSRRTPTVLYLLVLFGAFQPLQPFSVSARYANKQGTWKVSLRPIAASTWITAHERIYARPLARTAANPDLPASVVEKLRNSRPGVMQRESDPGSHAACEAVPSQRVNFRLLRRTQVRVRLCGSP
jgi:hypothetical protein